MRRQNQHPYRFAMSGIADADCVQMAALMIGGQGKRKAEITAGRCEKTNTRAGLPYK